MAWTEQCKVAFHANCTAKLGAFKNPKRKLRPILRDLSKESEIPFRTLENWWYEQSRGNSIFRENTEDKERDEKLNEESLCYRCGKIMKNQTQK